MTLAQFSLAGRRALVTGGGRGLGAAIARGIADAGASVAIASRSVDDVTATAAEIGDRATPVAVSVTDDPAVVVDLVEDRIGPVDIVIHAAGIQHRSPAADFDPAAWDRIVEVNLTAPFRLSQEVGRRQLARGDRGSHIFIGSLASVIGLPSVSAYAATKAGILGVVRSLSLEWSGFGIRVNAIGPGYFRTRLTEAVFADAERAAAMQARIPMGRFGEPSELAGTAVFLASEASGYMTGQLLMVDGGWTAA